MKNKIAGQLPLQEMIANVLSESRAKLAAAEEGKEEEKNEKHEKGESKKEEKKEHKKPSEKEESKKGNPFEKLSSSDSFYVDELIDALDYVAEKIAAGADIGNESHQGGTTLANNSVVGGEQSKKKDGSKVNQIPMHGGTQSDPTQGPSKTQVKNDAPKAPGGGGTQKVAGKEADEEYDRMSKGHGRMGAIGGAMGDASSGGIASAAHQVMKHVNEHGEDFSKFKMGKGRNVAGALAGGVVGGAAGHLMGKANNWVAGKMAPRKKESSAVESILTKIAEATQGGMQLSSASGQGQKPPSDSAGGNEARKALESNQAAMNMKKIDGKSPQKKMMSSYLKEPSQTSSTDSKLNENLRNTSKAGVKIAEYKEELAKIAAAGCTCDGASTCKYCKMQAAMKKKS
jgi:hypothetical protein